MLHPPDPAASAGPAFPRSGLLALWFTAWTTGRVSLDEAHDRVLGADAAHFVDGLPGEPEPLPLILALGKIRAAGAHTAGLALPVPGDPLGVSGPASFNTAALEAGEAVLAEDGDVGLVPERVEGGSLGDRAGGTTLWHWYAASSRRQVPDLPEATKTLRRVLSETANRLAELDVARWRPEVAEALTAVRETHGPRLPPGMDPRAVHTVGQALTCTRVVELARQDDGAAATAYEAEQRRLALAPLDRAARRSLVAACSFGLRR